jgi:hypothetical protein
MARHSSINHAKERRRRFDAERRRRDGAERMRTITFPGGNAPFRGSERVPIARASPTSPLSDDYLLDDAAHVSKETIAEMIVILRVCYAKTLETPI